MTMAQRRNRLTTHFSERIPAVKRRMSVFYNRLTSVYRGADKSLARPGRKEATATEDFDVHISYLLS